MNLNVEEIEDVKLAVGEACYNLFQTDTLGGADQHQGLCGWQEAGGGRLPEDGKTLAASIVCRRQLNGNGHRRRPDEHLVDRVEYKEWTERKPDPSRQDAS